MQGITEVTSAFASEPLNGRPYAYVRTDDEALSIDLRAWTPGRPGAPDFSLRVSKDDPIWLNLHQVNLLIARLTAARDAYQAALESGHTEIDATRSRLAEPDDAAPGHELIEPERFTSTITGADLLTVDGQFRDRFAIWHRPDGCAGKDWLIEAIDIYTDADISIGDVVELERTGRNLVTLVRVITPSGALPIDFLDIYDQACTPPHDEEERNRFYDEQRDSDERFDDALIGPGHEVALFPAVPV